MGITHLRARIGRERTFQSQLESCRTLSRARKVRDRSRIWSRRKVYPMASRASFFKCPSSCKKISFYWPVHVNSRFTGRCKSTVDFSRFGETHSDFTGTRDKAFVCWIKAWESFECAAYSGRLNREQNWIFPSFFSQGVSVYHSPHKTISQYYLSSKLPSFA